jgi:hypothetical protein
MPAAIAELLLQKSQKEDEQISIAAGKAGSIVRE